MTELLIIAVIVGLYFAIGFGKKETPADSVDRDAHLRRELERCDRLRAEGVLSEAEHAEARRGLLARSLVAADGPGERVHGPSTPAGGGGNVVAAIASFFIPGLGQLAQGRVGAAIAGFVVALMLWAFSVAMYLSAAVRAEGSDLLWAVCFGVAPGILSCVDAARWRGDAAGTVQRTTPLGEKPPLP